MSTTPDPIFYSFRRCPFAMRARLALAVGGVRVELREILLRAKPEAMIEASPKATVPVLVLPDGRVIDESIDIMRWALGRSDPEDWLARDDAALIATNDGAFKRHLDAYKYPNRHDGDATAHREAGLEYLRMLDARLQPGGQLCGSVRGLADAAIMPFARQFAAVDPEWFGALPLPALQAWLTGHIASPLFEAIMLRPSPWSPGDAPIYFPPATPEASSP